MKIFVTGGSGFLGQHVIRKLRKEGHTIGALARSTTSSKIVESLGATPIIGDLNQVSSFASALGGYEAVIHCAAPVEFWGPWEMYQEGIIDATLSLTRECNRQGLQKFIHLSSEAVLQDTKPLLDIGEDFPYPQVPNSDYGQAKKIVEERLMELPGPMKIVILRPSFIWGPGCPAFTEISEKVRTKQFFVSLNLAQPTKSFSGSLLKPLVNFLERSWRLLGIQKKPPLTRFDLAFVSMPRKYKIDRIRSELGYQPILSRAEGFKRLELLNQLS